MSTFAKIKLGLEEAIAYEKGELSTDIGHHDQIVLKDRPTNHQPVLFVKKSGSTSIVGVEKKEIVSSSARSTLGTAFMCGKTGYVF